MGNSNYSHYSHNTYISLVSDLYKKKKPPVYRYMNKRLNYNNIFFLNSPISDTPPNMPDMFPDTPTYTPPNTSSQCILKGGSAYNSPINSNNMTIKITTIENYIKDAGTPHNSDYKDITDIVYDTSDDEFVVI